MDKKNSKKAILEAAEAEFLEVGFHGATTASIAKRAGVTHAMLHYYFSTKENLYEVFISEKLKIVKGIVFPLLMTEDIDIIERVKMVIEKQFEYINEHPYIPRFMLNEVLTKPNRFRQLISNALVSEMDKFSIVQNELDKAADEGKINRITLPNLIINILSLNIISHMMTPIIYDVMPGTGENDNEFLEIRKREIIETITRRLAK